MAGTVTSDAQVVHNCDATSDWTGSPTLDTEVYIEGGGSLSAKVSKTTATFMKPITDPTDLSDTVIVVWVLGSSVAQFATKAAGGIRIRVENGATPDYTEWYVAGSDTGYAGGWQPLSVRTTQSADNASGSADLSNANAVGVVFNVTGSAAKVNCWWDNVIYGTKMTIYAGTSGSPATFADILAYEATNRLGFFTEAEGVIFCQSKLEIGSTSAGVNTYFADTVKTLVFRDKPFGTFYNITFQGNSTGDTQIYWGSKAGGRGVSGIAVSAAGTSVPTITITDTNIDNLGLYGCTFYNMGAVALPAYNANYEVLSCSFENCAQIDPDDGTVQYCNFVDTANTGGAVLIDQTDHRVTYCNFVNNGYGIEHSVAATYGYTSLKFAGNTVDIQNSSSATLVDSYQPTEDGDVDVYSGSITRVAQQFTATAGDLTRAIFSIRKQNSPTGNVYAKLYANSGGAPTGTALATSEAVNIADLTTSFADVEFEFEDEYTLVVSTEYHISIEYTGGDSTNRLEVEYLTAGSGSETCNTYVSSWGSQTYDCRFQVNRNGKVIANADANSDPTTATETAATKGATIISSSQPITITCVNAANEPVANVSCAIFLSADHTELLNKDSNASGIATENVSETGAIYWRVRESPVAGPRYKSKSGVGTIASGTGFSVTVVMEPETIT